MQRTEFNGLQLSSLGLGCSRLGSFGGATPLEAERIILRALECGINFLDTASSYGQGDSERLLARILSVRRDIFIATKVGKVVPLKARLLRPLKGALRQIVRSSPNTGAALRRTRGDSLPTCFESKFLQRQLELSLRRLRTDSIPIVMLHSPPASVLANGDAISQLERNREKGLLQYVGASVDDIEAAEAALHDERIVAIQVPVHPGESVFLDWAQRARQRGRLVIAREIFKGLASSEDKQSFISDSIGRVAVRGAAQVTLVGTTRIEHLEQILAIANHAIQFDYK